MLLLVFHNTTTVPLNDILPILKQGKCPIEAEESAHSHVYSISHQQILQSHKMMQYILRQWKYPIPKQLQHRHVHPKVRQHLTPPTLRKRLDLKRDSMLQIGIRTIISIVTPDREPSIITHPNVPKQPSTY